MELPKHTTQVGTISATKKLYVEDYCISYMKQLLGMYPEERKQIALFGKVERDKNIEYAFAYGAVLLGKGRGRTDSLTANQKEEAERYGQEYFEGMQLVGVVIATDAVDETVFWLGNGNKSIPLDGYYIFYDKNEAMLNFLIQNKKEEREVDLDPVIVKKADMDREKREKKEKAEQERLEAKQKGGHYRRAVQTADKPVSPEKRRSRNLFPVSACVLLVAITGIYGAKTYYPDLGLEQIKTLTGEAWAKAVSATGQYLSTEQLQESEASETEETLILVDNLTPTEKEVPEPAKLDVVVIPETDDIAAESVAGPTAKPEPTPAPLPTDTPKETVQETETDLPEEYLIKKGDNLLRILRGYYGDESRLQEICDVNGIVDPDNIQVGQTILLP